MAKAIPDLLTDDDLTQLAEVGQMMCDDMINEATVADTLARLGFEHAEPGHRVTKETTDNWVAIAQEYEQSFTEMEENRTL